MIRVGKVLLDQAKKGDGRIKNILRRALGDEHVEIRQDRKLERLQKQSRFGLKDFKRDDRLFVKEEDEVRADPKVKRDRRVDTRKDRHDGGQTEKPEVVLSVAKTVPRATPGNTKLIDDLDTQTRDELRDSCPEEFLPNNFISRKKI